MLPRQHPPASAPGPADPSSGEEICRKYIWGKCDKYAQCKFRHELDTERMKDILQFCHDYQNRNGCTRQNCKFLHATKEEQNQFEATGQIPRVLAERHAAMAAAASNMQTNAETIPQIAMFISESYMSQPPPAPWPPLPPPPAVMQPVATAPPPPPPSTPPRHAAALPPVQLTQQPPPPLAPTTSAQLRPAQTAYPAVPQSPSVLFSVNQPPPLVPPNFDATRPPPPIPTHIQPSNNGQLKRKIDPNGNAGSSKTRKPEGPEMSEAHCVSCVQRELRIDGYKQRMEALHNEEETQILLYKKKLQEYEIGRDILKTIVGPELFEVFDNLIEGAPSQMDNPGPSFISGSPTVSKQALLQLFQMLLGSGTRNAIEPVPSTSHMDDTLQSLTSISRRHNVGSYSNTGPDLIKFVVDTLRNSSAPDRSPSGEERPNEPTDMNRVNNRSNGYLANGQNAPASTSEPARYGAAAGFPAPTVQSQEFGARALPAMPNYSVAGPSGYRGAPVPAPPPPAAYPVFHPAIPPPNRPYYGPTPAPGSAPDRSPSGGEERPNEPTDMNRVNNRSNGYLANGQNAPASTSEPARYGAAAGFPAPTVQSQEFGARALPAMPNYSVAGPSGYRGAPVPAPPPPAAYPVFHPAIPPNRPYYGPTPAPGAPNMRYNGTERAPGPGPAQGMQPPATGAALRPAANAPNYNYMGRYPQPPYFPPYQ